MEIQNKPAYQFFHIFQRFFRKLFVASFTENKHVCLYFLDIP